MAAAVWHRGLVGDSNTEVVERVLVAVVADTLVYTLGFGTTKRAAMLGVYDRMAKSFAFEQSSPLPPS